jgi:hypothetical protein
MLSLSKTSSDDEETLPAPWSYVWQVQAASLARRKTRQTGFSRTGEKFHHPARASGNVKTAAAWEVTLFI